MIMHTRSGLDCTSPIMTVALNVLLAYLTLSQGLSLACVHGTLAALQRKGSMSLRTNHCLTYSTQWLLFFCKPPTDTLRICNVEP